MTVIPRPSHARPMHGLTLKAGRYLAEYTVDGRRRRRALGTSDPTCAILRRDAFYAALLARGAVRSCSMGATGTRRRSVPPDDPGRYIHRVTKPWRVKVGRHNLGSYRTREEAVAARNRHLATLD